MAKISAIAVAMTLGTAAFLTGSIAVDAAPRSPAPPVVATDPGPQCQEPRLFELTGETVVVNPDGCDARWYVRRGCAALIVKDMPIVIRWCAEDGPEPIPRLNIYEAHSITTVPAAAPTFRTPFRALYEIGLGGEATIEMVPCPSAASRADATAC
ncbi:MAG: hypothetical protein AB7O56_08320 [Bauldia sp.]